MNSLDIMWTVLTCIKLGLARKFGTTSDLIFCNAHWCSFPNGSAWLELDESAEALPWRHNGPNDVSNHQPRECLLNRLFGHKSKKTWKLRVTGLCAGNSPETGEFPAQMASNAENISIWWRHHGESVTPPIMNIYTIQRSAWGTWMSCIDGPNCWVVTLVEDLHCDTSLFNVGREFTSGMKIFQYSDWATPWHITIVDMPGYIQLLLSQKIKCCEVVMISIDGVT